MPASPIITSLLDQDMYKFSMGQAILFGRFARIHYQLVNATYEFINRANRPFPPGFADTLQEQINHMEQLQFAPHELQFLANIRYMKPGYIDFLTSWRWNAKHIKVEQDGEKLFVTIDGPWYQTVYYEVPLMALISELYFAHGLNTSDMRTVFDNTQKKGQQLAEAGCVFADFGTRRRYSKKVHDLVVQALIQGAKCGPGRMMGTSNMLLAQRYKITPIGTHAHEFFQAHAAMFGYRQANRFALEAWAEEYDGDLGIALSDTFTTDVFFRDFRTDLSKLFDGVRHDSGDPIEFAQKAIAHYKSLNIDPLSKTIVFSDGLNTDKAIEINQWCNGKIRAAFGIGTHFTNDVGVKPLNIVIKMTRCNGMPTVKLSDVEGKYTGQREAIESCKFQLGLNEV